MPDQEPAISPEQIAAAEALLGLNFTPAQREQMLEIVNGRRGAIRRLSAPNPTSTIASRPPCTSTYTPPTPRPHAVPRSYPMSAQPPVTRPANLEDAAFYPVTQLAELVRSRQVTSLELTEMYLARLRRYDPLLQCVATYTDELAIRQARRADDEIARGLYRGPLHGIPWGAKDLLATRGYPTQWGAKPYEGQQLDVDATVAQRLEAAGARADRQADPRARSPTAIPGTAA